MPNYESHFLPNFWLPNCFHALLSDNVFSPVGVKSEVKQLFGSKKLQRVIKLFKTEKLSAEQLKKTVMRKSPKTPSVDFRLLWKVKLRSRVEVPIFLHFFQMVSVTKGILK